MGGLGPSSLGVTKWGDCKSLKIKNARHTHHERKKYEGFGGRPPVGGRPEIRGPCPPPLNPALTFSKGFVCIGAPCTSDKKTPSGGW